MKCTKQEKKYVNNDKMRQRILTNDPFGNKIRASTLQNGERKYPLTDAAQGRRCRMSKRAESLLQVREKI